MSHDSLEFDAALAVTELEKSKADGIKSLIAAVKASARYQARAEKAEAALAGALVRNERQRVKLYGIRTIVTGHEAALVVGRVLAVLDGES